MRDSAGEQSSKKKTMNSSGLLLFLKVFAFTDINKASPN